MQLNFQWRMPNPFSHFRVHEFESKASQEHEIKLSQGYSQPLTFEQAVTLNKILKEQAYPLAPNPELKTTLPSLSFSASEVIKFLNNRLSKQHIIRHSSCDIGGGVARNVLAGLEYADVDISYHVSSSDYDKIIEIVKEFVRTKIKGKGDASDYLYKIERITKGNRDVGLFIGLGGVELKFICDETYRWNVATYDSFYILFSETNGSSVRSIQNGIVCDQATFNKRMDHLLARQFFLEDPQSISGLIYRVLLSQTQGFEILNPENANFNETTLPVALRQFQNNYSKQSLDTFIKKFHNYLSNHYRDKELPKMLAFLNFLGLILQIENPKEQQKCAEAIAIAWLQREVGVNNKPKLFFLADLIQSKRVSVAELLAFIQGAGLFEFICNNPSVTAYDFSFSGNSQKARWHLGIRHGESINYLAMPAKNPMEIFKDFLNSWISLSKMNVPGEKILNDLGFASLIAPTGEAFLSSAVVQKLMESFDQPSLAFILSKFFRGINPEQFCDFVKSNLPGLMQQGELERICVLSRLHIAADLSQTRHDAEAQKLVSFIRRRVRERNNQFSMDDLKKVVDSLNSVSKMILEPSFQKSIVDGLIYLFQKLEHPLSLLLIHEVTRVIQEKKLDVLSYEEKHRLLADISGVIEADVKTRDFNRLLNIHDFMEITGEHQRQNNVLDLISKEMMNLPDDCTQTPYACLDLLVRPSIYAERKRSAFPVIQKLLKASSSSGRAESLRLIAEKVEQIVSDVSLYKESFDLLLGISEKLFSVNKEELELGQKKQTYRQQGQLLFSAVGKADRDSVWQSEIQLRLLKEMAKSCSKNNYGRYRIYLNLFESLESTWKMVCEIKDLKKITEIENSSDSIKQFLQIIHKINPFFAEQTLLTLGSDLKGDDDKEDIQISLQMNNIDAAFQVIEKSLDENRFDDSDLINLLEMLSAIKLRKKDTLQIRKSLLSMLQRIIRSSHKECLLIIVERVFLVVKRISLFELVQLDDMALMLFKEGIQIQGFVSSTIFITLMDHFLNGNRSTDQKSNEKILRLFEVSSKSAEQREITLQLIHKVVQTGPWNKDVERCYLQIFINLINERKPNKELIDIWINRKYLQSLCYPENVKRCMWDLLHADLNSVTESIWKDVTLQMLVVYSKLTASQCSEDMRDMMNRMLAVCFGRKWLTIHHEQASFIFEVIKNITNKQNDQGIIDKESVTYAFGVFCAFLNTSQVKRSYFIWDVSKTNLQMGEAAIEELNSLVNVFLNLMASLDMTHAATSLKSLLKDFLPGLRTHFHIREHIQPLNQVIYDNLQNHFEMTFADLKTKGLTQEKIQKIFKSVNVLIPAYSENDPTKGRLLVKKIIESVIEIKDEWSKESKELLETAGEYNLFTQKTLPGNHISEMNAKEREKGVSEQVELQLAVIKKECKLDGNALEVISRLSKIGQQVDVKDQEGIYRLSHVALDVHDLCLFETIQKDNPCYLQFFHDVLGPQLMQEGYLPESHTDILYMLYNMFQRLIKYRTFFTSLGATLKEILDTKCLNKENFDFGLNALNMDVNSLIDHAFCNDVVNLFPGNLIDTGAQLIKRFSREKFIQAIQGKKGRVFDEVEFELVKILVKSTVFGKDLSDKTPHLLQEILRIHDDKQLFYLGFNKEEEYHVYVKEIFLSILSNKAVDWNSEGPYFLFKEILWKILMNPVLIHRLKTTPAEMQDVVRGMPVKGFTDQAKDMFSFLNDEGMRNAISDKTRKKSFKIFFEMLKLFLEHPTIKEKAKTRLVQLDLKSSLDTFKSAILNFYGNNPKFAVEFINNYIKQHLTDIKKDL